MATRKPIVIVTGQPEQVQAGDVVDPVSLGTGTRNAGTVLCGDSTYKTVTVIDTIAYTFGGGV